MINITSIDSIERIGVSEGVVVDSSGINPAYLVYTTGDQEISGLKTFIEGIEIGTATGTATLFVSGSYVGINNEAPLANLDVSGTVAFNERPTVNGTGVLLSGEAAIVENVVYTTGDQEISGNKTFTDGIEVGNPLETATIFVSGSYVGINNEAPLANLDVSGTVAFNERPTVNGTGVLLSGEVQEVTASGLGAISYNTGDATGIYSMRALTQAQYDLLTPDPNTFYVII